MPNFLLTPRRPYNDAPAAGGQKAWHGLCQEADLNKSWHDGSLHQNEQRGTKYLPGDSYVVPFWL